MDILLHLQSLIIGFAIVIGFLLVLTAVIYILAALVAKIWPILQDQESNWYPGAEYGIAFIFITFLFLCWVVGLAALQPTEEEITHKEFRQQITAPTLGE